MQALELRPDDRKVLMRLMQLYSDEKDWGRLVEIILKFTDLVEDDTRSRGTTSPPRSSATSTSTGPKRPSTTTSRRWSTTRRWSSPSTASAPSAATVGSGRGWSSRYRQGARRSSPRARRRAPGPASTRASAPSTRTAWSAPRRPSRSTSARWSSAPASTTFARSSRGSTSPTRSAIKTARSRCTASCSREEPPAGRVAPRAAHGVHRGAASPTRRGACARRWSR
jgi:hypothetical protein